MDNQSPQEDPLSQSASDNANPAADMIRQKLATIYAEEPNVGQEIDEVKAEVKPASKHQKFIDELSKSGKSLAEIQTAWHNYYVKLPDIEKHEVWHEFYASRNQTTQLKQLAAAPSLAQQSEAIIEHGKRLTPAEFSHQLGVIPQIDFRSIATIKDQLLKRLTNPKKLTAKHHLKSLGFGLTMGCLAVFIFLFSFFNQVIITPFIQPSRHIAAAPIIIDSTSSSTATTPEVIIPKINVEIPVDYSQTSDDESVIESALNNGVVHYPSTVLPGQNGNTAFFGHSSNNIFNPGKYKFAFVLLHTLVNGDTFYLTYQGKLYAYQVIDHKIVPPSDVAVLNDTEGNTATATLITCDPPGTSINRLIVTGVQISPSPSSNSVASAPIQAVNSPKQLASNGPSLWSRLWHWL